jgi:hypothetical protein
MIARVYVKGSLRNTADGFAFDLKNNIDSTSLTGFGPVKVGDKVYEGATISLVVKDKEYKGDALGRMSSIYFWVGLSATVKVTGETLPAGENKLSVSAISSDVGRVTFEFTDTISA